MFLIKTRKTKVIFLNCNRVHQKKKQNWQLFDKLFKNKKTRLKNSLFFFLHCKMYSKESLVKLTIILKVIFIINNKFVVWNPPLNRLHSLRVNPATRVNLTWICVKNTHQSHGRSRKRIDSFLRGPRFESRCADAF